MFDPSTLADYEALRQRSAFVHWNAHTRLVITGEDRTKFLNKYCSNDLVQLVPGSGCETFIPNNQGKIVGFVHLYCESDRWILETAAGQAAALMAHLDRYVLRAKVQFADASAAGHCLLLAGPAASRLLAEGTSQTFPGPAIASSEIEWHGLKLWVGRARLLLPESYLIVADASVANTLEAQLESHGARRCGMAACEALRIESGTPVYGVDVSLENFPQEFGIDSRAISFNKGCYLGQETIARIDAMGHVNWHWAGFQLRQPLLPPPGTELQRAEKPVARITSVTWSPRRNAPLAAGFVRRGSHQPGTLLDGPGWQAEVVALPLGEDTDALNVPS